MRGLPRALEPHKDLVPPSTEVVLHEGKMTLVTDGCEVSSEGSLRQIWSPLPALRFEGHAAPRQPELDLEQVTLRVPELRFEAPATIFGKLVASSGTSYSGTVAKTARSGLRRPIRELRFQLINFRAYVGERVLFGPVSAGTISDSRTAFRSHGVRIILDQVQDIESRAKLVKQLGGFAVTHTGLLYRSSSSAFLGVRGVVLSPPGVSVLPNRSGRNMVTGE